MDLFLLACIVSSLVIMFLLGVIVGALVMVLLLRDGDLSDHEGCEAEAGIPPVEGHS